MEENKQSAPAVTTVLFENDLLELVTDTASSYFVVNMPSLHMFSTTSSLLHPKKQPTYTTHPKSHTAPFVLYLIQEISV